MADDKGGPSRPTAAPHCTESGTLFRTSVRPHVAQAQAAALATTGTTGSTDSAIPSSSDWQVTNPSQWDGRERSALDAGSVLKERFVLERIVGKGGMGTVFCARDVRKEEAQDRFPYVAVKILNEDFKRHPESLKLLQREARKAQQLAHPNIVTVYDFDRDGANVFIVMELLQGESLDRVIKQQNGKGLPIADAFQMVAELGKALGYAHQKGVIHLDFKPANAHLCKDGTVKVLDFGIARAQQRDDVPEQEQTKFQVGDLGALTPSYASLEMQLGEDPDPRDDVYALACVTYELLTGKHPFGRQAAQFALEYKLWPTRPKGLSRGSWQALQRALAFKRAERTPSVAEFVADLTSKQSSAGQKWATAAAVVVVVGAVTYWQWPVPMDTPSLSPPPERVTNVQPRAPVMEPLPPPKNAEATPIDASPVVVQPEIAPTSQPNTERQRERLLQLARTNDVDAAMDVLNSLRAELPANDPFLNQEGPQAIALAHLRLADRALQKANYAASSDYILAAQRLSPELRSAQQSKETLNTITRLESSLRVDRDLNADNLSQRLAIVKVANPSAYPTIEKNLALVLATRIERDRRTDANGASALLAVATQVFGHVPSIAALNRPTQRPITAPRVEATSPAVQPAPQLATQIAPQVAVVEKPVAQQPIPEPPKVEPVKPEPEVQAAKPVEVPKEQVKEKKKDKPNVIVTF